MVLTLFSSLFFIYLLASLSCSTFYGISLVKTNKLLRWNDIVKKFTSLKINKWGKERLICSEKCTGTWRQMSPDVVVDFVIDLI